MPRLPDDPPNDAIRLPTRFADGVEYVPIYGPAGPAGEAGPAGPAGTPADPAVTNALASRLAVVETAADDVWLAVGFHGDDQTSVWLYASSDGVRFAAVDTRPMLTSPTGVLRDPHLSVDDAARTAYLTGTTGDVNTPATLPRFHVFAAKATAAGLRAWATIGVVDMNTKGLSGVTRVWAPELWTDPANGARFLLVSVEVNNSNTFRPYALPVTAISSTAITVGNAILIDWPRSGMVIDPVIVRDDAGLYHAFVKSQRDEPVGGYVEHGTATSRFGPYTLVHTDDAFGFGWHTEAPEALRLAAGLAPVVAVQGGTFVPTWQLFIDHDDVGQPSFIYLSADFTKWSAPARAYFEGGVRHAGYVRSREPWLRDVVDGAQLLGRITPAVEFGVFRYIGDPGEPALANGFGRLFGNDRNLWPKYMREGRDVEVLLWLSLPGGALTPGLNITTLPVGFRPHTGFWRESSAVVNDSPAVIDFGDNGDINVHQAPAWASNPPAGGGRYLSLRTSFKAKLGT